MSYENAKITILSDSAHMGGITGSQIHAEVKNLHRFAQKQLIQDSQNNQPPLHCEQSQQEATDLNHLEFSQDVCGKHRQFDNLLRNEAIGQLDLRQSKFPIGKESPTR